MNIVANQTYYQQLNEQIRACEDAEITLEQVFGQRYLGCASKGKHITIHGTPGNGLGQYLNGTTLEVYGNAQEACGDTMNDGDIIIHGGCGDNCGYGMRGGRIFVKDSIGYRGGIHMKSYMEKSPVLVVGGHAGSFLGEYLAGGLIVVLGKDCDGAYPASYFCGTGMHGGKIVMRCDQAPTGLPKQVLINEATAEDISEIRTQVEDYCSFFGGDADALLNHTYFVLTPNPNAGYKQLYTYE